MALSLFSKRRLWFHPPLLILLTLWHGTAFPSSMPPAVSGNPTVLSVLCRWLASNDQTKSPRALALRGGEQSVHQHAQAPGGNIQEDTTQWEVAAPRLTQSRFEDLEPKLSNQTLSALTELRFTLTAPVQQAVIPLLMTNKDVIVQAPTGSGKTAAFLIPAFELLMRSGDERSALSVGAIVILPTRELASQVGSIASCFAKHTNFPSHELVGGSNQTLSEELLQKNGGNLLVATPGRLKETLTSKKPLLRVSDLLLLVLDEADRLLEMGFQATLSSIFRFLPKQRRTGLFSATMGSAVADLARAGLRNPRRVTVSVQGEHGGQQATPQELSNFWTQVKPEDKLQQLVHLLQGLQARGTGKVMVFMLTCSAVDYLARLLPRLDECRGLTFMGLNGKQVQKRRDKTYAAFVAAKSAVLLCTDVAARGLDVPDVDWVVQYDPPQDADMFVHRVGRAGRMGRGGKSLVMLCPNELSYLEVLRARRLPIGGLKSAGSGPALLQSIRGVLRRDRDLVNKGERAFVSSVRAYREHRCEQVFKLAELDLAGLATGFGLLRLPFMRELLEAGAKAVKRQLVLPGFEPDDTDPRQVKFRDPAREKARVEREAREAEEARAGRDLGKRGRAVERNKSWSKKLERMERREKRRRRKEFRPHALGAPAAAAAAEEAEEESEGEREQLRKEMAMLKKLKRRRVTPQQFDAAFPLPE